MIILKLRGGLGNQLFAYVYASRVAEELGTTLYIDTMYYRFVRNRKEALRAFGIDVRTPPWSSYLPFGRKMVRVEEKEYYRIFRYQYDPSKDYLLDGYWQHPSYVEQMPKRQGASLLRIVSPSTEYQRLIHQMKRAENSISLHVRRTDFLSLASFGACTPKYYDHAIQYASQRLKNCVFYVFSDDLEWARERYGGDQRFHFIDNLGSESEDLMAMSYCHHHIISNSTFSWWSAWLGTQRKTGLVVAPKPWVSSNPKSNVLLLPKWVKLDKGVYDAS